jgi:DNA-binding response OmpR family regulator
MLTAHAGVGDRVEGLDAGADDFMGKPFAVAELRARVRALGRRKGMPASIMWSHQNVQLDLSKRQAVRAGRTVPMTSREWEILRSLAAARGGVVSQGLLLDEIWGEDTEAKRASLEVLIGRIRKKLGESVIRTIRGEGYALRERD